MRYVPIGIGQRLSLALLAAGCSGGAVSGEDDALDSDSRVELDTPWDLDGGRDETYETDAHVWVPDATHDWSGTEFLDAAAPDLPYVEQCGNGVVDPGEECDDDNRMNGDGCDWQCRVGDGEPPPPPDPDVDDYVPSGDGPGELAGLHEHVTASAAVVVWTGTEFATAYREMLPPDELSHTEWVIHFHRFDRGGRAIDADWLYPGGPDYAAVDLAWTGSGFGLFWIDLGWGVVLMLLDPDGKPRGGPMLVEPDATAVSLAADWTGDGFVVAWSSDLGGSLLDCAPLGLRPLRVALLGPDGSTAGRPEPLVVDDAAATVHDVAAGPSGFGVVAYAGTSLVEGGLQVCGSRFFWTSADLSRSRSSGTLSEYTWAQDARWTGDAYLTAWPETAAGDDRAIRNLLCVGRFAEEGDLETAPVCSDIRAWGYERTQGVRMAAGDGGAALVFDAGPFSRYLLAVRTDVRGVPVAGPHAVFDPPPDPWVGPNWAVAWAGDDAFGVLFAGGAWEAALRLFERAE